MKYILEIRKLNTLVVLLIAPLVFFQFAGCGSPKNSTVVQYNRLDTIRLNIFDLIDEAHLKKEFKFLKLDYINDSIEIYYYNHSDETIVKSRITLNDSALFTTKLQYELEPKMQRDAEMLNIGKDTTLFFSNDAQMLHLYYYDARESRTISFDTILSSGVIVSVPSSYPYIYSNGSFICSVIFQNNEIVDNDNVPTVICYNIQENSIINFGQNPVKYSDYFYYDFYSSLSNGINHQIIISPKAHDSLFIFKGTKLDRTIEAKSAIAHEFNPFKRDKISSQNYSKEYVISEPKYFKFVYDNYRGVYYRFFKFPQKEISKNGELLSMDDIPWSIIVLDEDFQKLGEVEINDIAAPLFVLPIPEGVLISHSSFSDIQETGVLDLVLYDFNFEK